MRRQMNEIPVFLIKIPQRASVIPRASQIRTLSTVDQFPQRIPRRHHSPSRSVDTEPGSSPDNPIDLENVMDQEHDTQPLNEDRGAEHLDGDTEPESNSETGTGRDVENMPLRDAERETDPTIGSRESYPDGHRVSYTGTVSEGSDKENVEPLLSLPTKLADDVSVDGPLKETPTTVSESPSTCAGDGCLEYLLWAPAWWTEDELAQIAPDQLKQYKEKLDIGSGSRGSQVRKRAASHSPQVRRSSRTKKPRQCAGNPRRPSIHRMLARHLIKKVDELQSSNQNLCEINAKIMEANGALQNSIIEIRTICNTLSEKTAKMEETISSISSPTASTWASLVTSSVGSSPPAGASESQQNNIPATHSRNTLSHASSAGTPSLVILCTNTCIICHPI
ncbi:hypothetical protein PAAG_05009 [Paracoccidioides lutzii Pb01]|uniref:Uncharacterized protein n=1 Tax=Paracoccidioides lutzii (strain ATCC MYA-826 / Pb01) TaxID=502779 RepID=C1H2L6_PARBA|nr:hypothetical protein PAAG_05009 [Paracoccidioides lutzii Pb01]EEH33960.2 hypothetical protein PAAG_05009 [Paracoccidioides lutzii Pb01]